MTPSAAVTTAKAGTGVLNMLGPFVLSQSRSLSENYALHLGRQLTVEAAKEIMLQEATTLNEVKGKLLSKFYEAAAEQRISIRRDLEEVDACLREVSVRTIALSLPALPEGSVWG